MPNLAEDAHLLRNVHRLRLRRRLVDDLATTREKERKTERESESEREARERTRQRPNQHRDCTVESERIRPESTVTELHSNDALLSSPARAPEATNLERDLLAGAPVLGHVHLGERASAP